MRICQITSAHPWQDERIFMRCTRGLAKRGHQMVYIAPIESARREEAVSILPVTPNRSKWERILLTTWEAFRIARQLNADIYHYHDPELHPFMDVLKRMGKRVVFDMHENYAGAMRNRLSGWKRDIFPDWFAKYEQYLLPRLDGVVFVSQSQADLFAGQVKRSCVIRNIIDLSRLNDWTPPPRQDPPVILSAGGSLGPERQVDKLVEALPLIHEEFPDARVRFLGKYAYGYEHKIPEMAAKLGVADHVDVDGWVPWVESFDEIAKASIGTVFYQDNENNQIGLPNRVFSYMFAKLPLLMSDYTELRRVAEETGAAEIINTEDPRNIAEVVKALLRDRDRLEAMGQKGRDAVFENYNYAKELDSLEAMYDDILAR